MEASMGPDRTEKSNNGAVPARRVTRTLARAGGVLAAISGRAISGRAVARRGNVLVLVLGTLALMSVVAAIYVAIGQSDRRTALATKEAVEQRDTVGAVSGYLAGVVGRDVFSAYPVRVDTPLNVDSFDLFREAHDYPYTDFTFTSDIAGLAGIPFDPAGTHLEVELDASISVDSVASDPWLASTEPTFLGRMDFSGAGAGLDDRLSAVDSPTHRWFDNRDWWQISNFAPDGRFVNLFNLRNNFSAEPGFDTDSQGLNRMSEGLNLFELTSDGVLQASNLRVDGVDVTTNLEKRRPANFTMFQRGAAFPIGDTVFALGTGGQQLTWADGEYPLYQWADADGDRVADSRWFELVDASDRDAPRDLLGSGDIRYFVAARAVDLSALVNVNTASDQLAGGRQYLDAGASAQNQGVVPGRPGATPAEVDLRRLLMNTDAAERHTRITQFGAIPLALADLEPVDPDRSAGEDYLQIGPGTLPVTSSITLDIEMAATTLTMQGLGAMGYAAMSEALQTGATPNPAATGPRTLSGAGIALEDTSRFDSPFFRMGQEVARVDGTGATDYDRFRRERTRRRLAWYHVAAQFSAPDQLYSTITEAGPPVDVASRTRDITSFDLSQFGVPDQQRRFDEVHDFETGFFGLEDLEELLTYRSVNNPAVTSRLELTIDNRLYPFPNLTTADATEYLGIGPMRSGRGLLAERGGRDADTFDHASFFPGYPDPDAGFTPDGALDADAMAHLALDVRQRLTTLSGVRPIRGGVEADGLRYRRALTDLGGPAANFALLADALAPGLGRTADTDLWRGLEHTQTDTLFYGGRGPETALNVAAHLAVNMPEAVGLNPADAAYTLILDNTIRDELNGDLNNAADPSQGADLVENQTYPELNWAGNRIDANVLDLDPDANSGNSNGLLADSGDFTGSGTPFEGDLAQPVVNIYPAQAYPVITSVASFTVYNDASESPAVSTDITSSSPPGGDLILTGNDASPDHPFDGDERIGDSGVGNFVDPVIQDCDLYQRSTIDGRVDRRNPDHVVSLLAIQLTNPFDERIVLWQEPTSGTTTSLYNAVGLQGTPELAQLAGRSPEFYYIEYAGKYYELAEMRERIYQRTVPSNTSVEFEDWDVRSNTDVESDEDFETSPAVNPALANRYYPDTPGSPGTVSLRFTAIEPGQSIVVYALSERPKNVSRRFSHANKRTVTGQQPIAIPDDAVSLHWWIQGQLRRGDIGTVIQIPQVSVLTSLADPANGDSSLETPGTYTGAAAGEFGRYLINDEDFNDPLAIPQTNAGADAPWADRDTVKLWRAVRAEVAPAGTPEDDPSQGENQLTEYTLPSTSWFGATLDETEFDILEPNNIRNDQLVERFRLDGNQLLQDSRLLPEVIEIAGTGFTGQYRLGQLRNRVQQDCAGRGDILTWDIMDGDSVDTSSVNLGYTITTWAEAGRPVPPGNGGVLSTVGNIPYYMMEPKDPANASFRRPGSAADIMIPLSGGTLFREDFDDPNASARLDGYQDISQPFFRSGTREGDISFQYWLFEQAGRLPIYWMRELVTPGYDPEATQFEDPQFADERGFNGFRQCRNITIAPSESGTDPLVASSWLDTAGTQIPFEDLELSVLEGEAFSVPASNTTRQIASVQTPLPGATATARDIELAPARLADIFNTAGFGPRHAPYVSNGAGTLARLDTPLGVEDHERTWLTMGEALALVLGYERTNSTDLALLDERNRGALRVFGWDAPTGTPFNPATGPDHARVLEAGRLRPTDYTPFFDVDTDYAFDPANADLRWGDGLTPGMRLLEAVRGVSSLVETETGAPGPIIGTININTAPESVLRAIGLWTPSLARSQNPGAAPGDELFDYWPLREPTEFARYGGPSFLDLNTVENELGLPVLAKPGDTEPLPANEVLAPVAAANRLDIPDVAATVAAYRDRMWGEYRPASIPELAVASGTVGNLSPNARPSVEGDSFFGYPVIFPAFTGPQTGWLDRNFAQDNNAPLEPTGRSFQTGITGLREQPGFATLGELLAITAPADIAEFDSRYTDGGAGLYDSASFENGVPVQRDAIRHLLMDYLGYDTTGAGANATPRPLGPEMESRVSLGANPQADGVANEYDERFALANSAFNLLSVGSDYYAVWFLLHGYRATDVQGLGPDDPMLPSIQRRFLMILDRSNVTSEGQQPRVLLLREVPL